MTTATTDFVPAELDATNWANLQPLYQALLDRELKCAGCLEQLLLDRSRRVGADPLRRCGGVCDDFCPLVFGALA